MIFALILFISFNFEIFSSFSISSGVDILIFGGGGCVGLLNPSISSSSLISLFVSSFASFLLCLSSGFFLTALVGWIICEFISGTGSSKIGVRFRTLSRSRS